MSPTGFRKDVDQFPQRRRSVFAETSIHHQVFASVCHAHGHGGVSVLRVSSLALIIHPPRLLSPPMKNWTTPDERAWLTERIPQWHRRKSKRGKTFLRTTVADFIQAFPKCSVDRSKLKSVSLTSFFLPPTPAITNSIPENSTVVL